MRVAAVQPDFRTFAKLGIDIETRGAAWWIGGCGGHMVFYTYNQSFVMLNLFQHLAIVLFLSEILNQVQDDEF
ncbi:hypothetical protein GCM10009096_32180 [Parasphingorhabdus litoris]|uniref:Uncharacterized protein n=1 Tax=Parasphingorhabdus litoris TaxID=394733 RepID=A0ABN1AZ36_9SPHN